LFFLAVVVVVVVVFFFFFFFSTPPQQVFLYFSTELSGVEGKGIRRKLTPQNLRSTKNQPQKNFSLAPEGHKNKQRHTAAASTVQV
jgi:flagellar biosynthesis/type III secretory pathway M-ring protein FliF/YscJ